MSVLAIRPPIPFVLALHIFEGPDLSLLWRSAASLDGSEGELEGVAEEHFVGHHVALAVGRQEDRRRA